MLPKSTINDFSSRPNDTLSAFRLLRFVNSNQIFNNLRYMPENIAKINVNSNDSQAEFI